MTVSQIELCRLKNILTEKNEEQLSGVRVCQIEIKKIMSEYFDIDKKDINFEVKKLGDYYSIKMLAKAKSVKKINILP